MSEKTLTRMELSEAVFRTVGLSRNESAELVELVLNHMSDALVRGELGEHALDRVELREGRDAGGEQREDHAPVAGAPTLVPAKGRAPGGGRG